ncbi:MAG: efflux RND transporter permease subunit [Treponema sp.]|nr:efflux RND transporter permease subunit [Treponema sp.]
MRELLYFFIRRPVTVIMILLALIIAAVYSLFTLPVNRLPEFSVPRVTIETLYPGMAANEIRSMVTIPLEDGLSPVKGLERIRSVSRDNSSVISLDFRWGIDPMTASVPVREAIDAVYQSLPEGVKKPTVTSGDSGNEPHIVIAVSSRNKNGEFARKLAEFEIRARLRRIDGVGSIVLSGGEVSEEKLILDLPKLSAIGMSPSEFINLLTQETADIPAGNARDGNLELVVVSSGMPDSVYSLSRVILPVSSGGLKIEDSGELFSASAKRNSIFVYDGKEAVSLEVYRRPGYNPLKLSKDVEKAINEASLLFSRDAVIEIVTDSSSSLLSGIKGLVISAIFAAIAVITVLIIFIRRIKYSFFAALSIPISFAAGICILSIFGKSLNGMSLGGLAMGIGLVSDLAVIVIDILHRAFGERKAAPLPEEIGNKVYSIAGSSISSSLTTAIVFLPIIMLPGPLGSLFGDIAIALVTSVIAGWIYAQFFLPSLFLQFFDSKKLNTVLTSGSLVRKYSKILSVCFRRPVKIFFIAVFLSVLGFLMLFVQPLVFINPDDAEEVWVSVTSPPGILLESILDVSVKASSLLSGLPLVDTVYGKAGAEEEDIGRRADIDYKKEELILRCQIKKGVKPEKALAVINSTMKQFADLQYSVFLPRDKTEILLGLSSEQTLLIKGKDREELLEQTEIVKNYFKTELIDVFFRPFGQRSELRFLPNREAAAYLSISAAHIAETLFILNEGVIAAHLEVEGRPLDVRVTGNINSESDPIKRLEQIPVKTPQGKTVFLGSLGKIERKEADAVLTRLDRSDVIYADAAYGKKIPENVMQYAVMANDSVFSRYRNSLFIYVLLVFILLYMAMGAQFESFLLPLILMLTIPFSLAGAGPLLLVTNTKIDSGVILGLTALFGLAVNNSLILYEICNEKIKNGLSPALAVYCGTRERFAAILITMMTTIFALLPIVLNPLGNSQKSMACAMLGGITASTLISLFAIPPVLIKYFKWKQQL